MLEQQAAIDRILKFRPDFMTGIEKLDLRFLPGDGMLDNSEVGVQYYFECGKSALDLIDQSLKSMDKPRHKIRNVLDFACGFGRVTRWLLAAFPHAELAGYDVDKRAVGTMREVFKVNTTLIDHDWSNVPDKRFDLIWVGSLFTHLSKARAVELSKLLHKRLQPGGVLAATFHGRHVTQRIRSREKLYGLTNEGRDAVISGVDNLEYGFAPYETMADYGISITNLREMDAIVSSADLKLYFYLERGWMKHQDFIACHR